MAQPLGNGLWRDLDHIEHATLDWVHWYTIERTHGSIDDLTPTRAEEVHYTHRTSLTEAA